MREFLTHYMPMKFGSSLTSKLNKKNKVGESYWERGVTANKPFILAIKLIFHKTGGSGEVGSMTYTAVSAVAILVWPSSRLGNSGGRIENSGDERYPDHVYGEKVVPSGFFDLPGAENVSAVLFSNAGTLAKFDRMGVAAGFAPADHRYFRIGLRYNPDRNAVQGIPFSTEIQRRRLCGVLVGRTADFSYNPERRNIRSPQRDFGGITSTLLQKWRALLRDHRKERCLPRRR